jgi:hypothetical protein
MECVTGQFAGLPRIAAPGERSVNIFYAIIYILPYINRNQWPECVRIRTTPSLIYNDLSAFKDPEAPRIYWGSHSFLPIF